MTKDPTQDMTDPKNTPKESSFLDQTQLEGKSSGKVSIDLEQAIEEMSHIVTKDEWKDFSGKGDDDWDSIRLAVYCHDCRKIVPPGVGKSYRGKMRTVCGTCQSKKISSGREEALQKYYGIEESKTSDKDKSDPKSPAKGRKPAPNPRPKGKAA